MARVKRILIAGPYRSGTNGDPEKIAANLRYLESFALQVYKAGHLPFIGEWLALPIIEAAARAQNVAGGDMETLHEEYLYPVAHRLIRSCDAVLRVPGASRGADQDVQVALENGLEVFYDLDEIGVNRY